MYEEEDEPRLSTLPSSHATPQRNGLGAGPGRPPQQTEGSLLGDEFTSPHSNVKKGD